MPSKKGFQPRSFASLLLCLSGLTMTVSGVVLYIVPEGRIAYWNDWRLLALGKEQWGAMHTILSLLFFLTALLHLYYNWRVLMAYLRDRVRKTLTLRRELAAAALLCLVCLAGSIAGTAPFSQVMALGMVAKKAWYAGQDVKPPFPHAELMTLSQLAKKIDFSLDGAVEHLREKGFADAGAASTLKGLATGHPLSPAEIFETMMLDDRLYR